MTQFVAACKITDIAPGKGRVVAVNGMNLAVFNNNGTFTAMSNTCPHRGGPLGDGDFSEGVVSCPWHGFQFDCATGTSADGRPMRVATYPARVTNGVVEIGL